MNTFTHTEDTRGVAVNMYRIGTIYLPGPIDIGVAEGEFDLELGYDDEGVSVIKLIKRR
jgi:hypothetical protein